MRQFILPEEWKGDPTCRIEGGAARYLLRVLRLAPGDTFAGLDASGCRHRCELLESGLDYLLLKISAARLEDEAGLPRYSGFPRPAPAYG